MTADAPHPDPSLPPPMDAVGGADALTEGDMPDVGGCGRWGCAVPFHSMPSRLKADGAMMRCLISRGFLTAKREVLASEQKRYGGGRCGQRPRCRGHS